MKVIDDLIPLLISFHEIKEFGCDVACFHLLSSAASLIKKNTKLLEKVITSSITPLILR